MKAVSSMHYTIGTAIDRASEAGYVVELLVEGSWVTGLVVANDGIGVVLDNEGQEHCIVRLERIAAVRVAAEAPMLRRLAPVGTAYEGGTFDEAMPMPAPRAATD